MTKLKKLHLDSLEKFLSRVLKIQMVKLEIEIGVLFILLSITIYTVILSLHTILQHYSFLTYAWDLGIYNQALWTTLKHGKLFYYTCELHYVPNGSFFGIHFSPILYCVIPFYALFPQAEALLIFQSFILALGALPLYLLTRDKINRTLAVVFSLAYLIYSPLHGINCYDFHVQAFLPVLLFSVFYLLHKKRWYTYLLFVTLALMVMEQVSPIIIFLGIYLLVQNMLSLLKSNLKSKIDKKSIFFAFITIIYGISWFILSQHLIYTINPSPPPELKAGRHFTILGVSEPLEIPVYIMTHPSKVFEALSFDWYQKLSYLTYLFAPLAFFSILSPSLLIMTIPWFGISLLSNYPPYYALGFQYPGFIIPFIFISAVMGVKKFLGKKPIKKRLMKNILIFIALISSFFCLALSPLSPLIAERYSSASYLPPKITDHESMLNKIIKLVPQETSLLTQDNIFPHVSSRLEAYVFPPIWMQEFPSWNQAISNSLSLNTTYILFDMKTSPNVSDVILSKMIEKKDYGLYAYADRIFLFKLHYHEEPIFFEPKNVKYDYRRLILLNGELLEDPTSVSEQILCHKPIHPSFQTFWYGPYEVYPPSCYTVTFWLKVGSLTPERIITLDVVSDAGNNIIVSKDIFASDFHEPKTWQNFTFTFTLDETIKNIEFRGYYVSNVTDIYLDCILVEQT